MRLLIAAVLAAAAFAGLGPSGAEADQQSYTVAVEQARGLVREGQDGRADAARQAVAVLVAGTGDTQPEVLADLRRDPPDYQDAGVRLAAVAAALARPGTVADPGAARARLAAILAQSRYDGLRAGQSPWDRFWNWVFTNLLNWLAGLPLGSVPSWVVWVLALPALLLSVLVAILIARSGWSRAAALAETVDGAAPAAGVDRFARADAAAARGEWTEALRWLVAGVATRVSGRPYWESSPLTVRELFRASGEIDRLRPLLLAFERAVYGFQPVDESEYRRLAALAAPYRLPPAERAA